jgi:ferredoxin
MTFHVKVDEELCIGSGNCVHLAKGVFELNEDGLAVVVDETAASEEDLRLAERTCPTGAILVDGDAADQA